MKKILLLLCFIFISFSGYSKDTITWLVINWPPFMILENNQVKGQLGMQLTLLQKNLPEYNHKNLTMNWARFWHNVKKGEHYCNTMAYKSAKREKIATFSDRFTIALGNAIIMEKKTLKKFGFEETQSLSLVKLLKRKDAKGILIKTRSYSAQIDKILEIHENSSNIVRFPAFKENAILLLLSKRMDYMLEYPSTTRYMRQKVSHKPGNLISMQIEEIEPISYGHIACPKNEWGKQLVGKLNTILKKEKPTLYFRKLIEMIATNKQEVQLVRDAYPDFLK